MHSETTKTNIFQKAIQDLKRKSSVVRHFVFFIEKDQSSFHVVCLILFTLCYNLLYDFNGCKRRR